MIGGIRNDQKLQVSVHQVMRRKLPLLHAGVTPPGRPFCTTLGEIADLVSDRDAEGHALRMMPKESTPHQHPDRSGCRNT